MSPQSLDEFFDFAAVMVISAILGLIFVWALAELVVLILGHPSPRIG